MPESVSCLTMVSRSTAIGEIPRRREEIPDYSRPLI